VQETIALRSKALKLIFFIRTFFPNFPVKILIGSEMLSANRKNQVVDKLVVFEKALAFWINLVWICKILCTKVVCQIAVVRDLGILEKLTTELTAI
jgi:hypothetical protein